MRHLLQVKNLQVSYKKSDQLILAVRGVDLILQEGETLGIVGESGCGKSTLAKALLKLLPSHSSFSGDIFYSDQMISHTSETEMQKIRGKELAMIFQDPLTFLNPTMKIGDQILEGYFRHIHGAQRPVAETLASTLLQELGFEDPKEILNAYPHTLSGGMRQRIMMAIALICDPKVLVADEPTSSLDEAIQQQILSTLKKKQSQNKMGIVWISHDITLVSQFCDRVLVMHAGKIVETATVETLFRDPKHPYTQMLIELSQRFKRMK